MIIDHDTMTQMGPTDETMPLRVVGSDETLVPAGSTPPEPPDSPRPPLDPPWVNPIGVDFAAAEERIIKAMATAEGDKDGVPSISTWGKIKGTAAWMQMRKGWHYRHQAKLPGSDENIHGNPPPFVGSVTGRLSISPLPLHLETFAREAPIEDVVEAVVALSDKPEGVVRKRPTIGDTRAFLLDEDDEVDHENTGTYALPAVWKLTGQKSGKVIAHRSAAHVQKIFNEAGWPIAVWYGEHTGTYWVMDETGLHEFDTVTLMYQGMGWESL